MAKRMLIDATHAEETRVVVMNGTRLEEFDVETSTKKQLKGNIYLAKIVRVEPSLQAAFVDYGGNRHGFLAFSEIHPDYYQIPPADRKALLAEQREVMRQSATAASADFGDAEDGEEETGAGGGPVPEEQDAGDPLPNGGTGEDHPPTAEDEGDEAAAPPPGPFPLAPAAAEPQDPATAPAEEALLPVEHVGGDDMVEEGERRRKPLRNYKIQEVIKRRQIVLVQVVKEERGNKGAALTTYLSLAGRYCVLMPNTARGGGVSRKITNIADRKRLKSIANDMDIPDGMAVIIRTAGSERTQAEIKRDYEYLLRLWDSVRNLTLRSAAAALVYEEANLIKRSIRDLYSRDIDEILVDGQEGYRLAKDFMHMLTPSHTHKVQLFREPVPLLHKFGVEAQLDAMHSPVVQLRSGGYLVINQTEALVAIDVNSGRSTKERHIEETALKTNLEASDEVARQLRLRDLAGLIVIDFIDMEETRNNHQVERRLKEAMRFDRARIQLGRISPFGLLELSRQRLRPSLMETSFQPCPHCGGTGLVRSVESASMHVLRAIEEEGLRLRSAEVTVTVHPSIALYILNQKRASLGEIERTYGFRVLLAGDDALIPPAYRMDRVKAELPIEAPPLRPINGDQAIPDAFEEDEEVAEEEVEETIATAAPSGPAAATEAPLPGEKAEDGDVRRRRRRRRRRGRREEGLPVAGEETLEDGEEETAEAAAEAGEEQPAVEASQEAPGAEADAEEAGSEDAEEGEDAEGEEAEGEADEGDEDETDDIAVAEGDPQPRRRRRGKRGGRRRHRGRDGLLIAETDGETGETAAATDGEANLSVAETVKTETVEDSAPANVIPAEGSVEVPSVEVPSVEVIVTGQAVVIAAEPPVTAPADSEAEAPLGVEAAAEPVVLAEAPIAVPPPVEAVTEATVAPVAAPVETLAEPAAETVEAPPVKPKRPRARKKPVVVEADVPDAAAQETATNAGEAALESPPVKPKRPRTRKKPVATAEAPELPLPTQSPGIATEAPAPAEAPPAETQPAETPAEEPAEEPQENGATDPDDEAARSRRRGWWNRAG